MLPRGDWQLLPMAAVSLTSPSFVAPVTLAAVVLLAVSLRSAPRRAIGWALGGTVVAVAVAAAWISMADPFHSGFPVSFYAWGAAPILAAAVAATAWPRSTWRRRAIRVVAVPVCLVFAAATINVHYAYIPTLAALRGQQARDQVSQRRAAAIARHASNSNTIPARGVVLALEVPAPRSRFHARAPFVYLPPAWFATPRPPLPVVVLIAGSPGTPADWTRGAGADVVADKFAAAHGGFAPVLVMPDVNGGPFDDTECVDGPRGRVETYLVEDLRPFIVREYGVNPDRRAWAVAGLSEGGTCSVVLALRHPEAFGSFADFGGQAAPTVGGHDLNSLYGSDVASMRAHTPAVLLASGRYPELGGWFEVGMGDYGARLAARKLAPMVAAAGGEACLVERHGIHNFVFWHDAFDHALPWLVARTAVVRWTPESVCAAVAGRFITPLTPTTTTLPPRGRHHRR